MDKESQDTFYDEELERSFNSVANKYVKKKKASKPSTGSIIAICAASLVLLISIIVLIVVLVNRSAKKNASTNNLPIATQAEQTYSGTVTVFGVKLNGLTKAEAIEQLTQKTAELGKTSMKVKVNNIQLEIPAEVSAFVFNVEDYVEAVFAVSAKESEKLNLDQFLTMDRETASGYIAEQIGASASNSENVVDGICEIVEEVPTDEYLSAEKIDNFSLTLKVTMGTTGSNLTPERLCDFIYENYKEQQFVVSYDVKTTSPKVPNTDAAFSAYCVEAVDSQYDKAIGAGSDHKYGYTFDLEEVNAWVAEAQEGEAKTFQFTLVAPTLTKEALDSKLFADKLSTHTAYASSVPGGRNVNLELSCEKINNYILEPGDIFDYNTTLGERTKEGGWAQADGYSNGETVKMYGGGICQTSSVLYYCTLLADLEIVTRENHGYISSYMDPGMDATVSWGGPEFQFRNNTDYPIRIEAYSSDGDVTISIYGTDTKDYYVKMEYETLDSVPYKTVEEEYAPDNDKGYKDGQVLTSGYTGYKVQTYRCKYDKKTNELISKEKEAYNVYNNRDKVVVKIVEPKKETEPTQAPTEPPTTAEPTTEPTTAPTEDPWGESGETGESTPGLPGSESSSEDG